jgi:hypothetical protein
MQILKFDLMSSTIMAPLSYQECRQIGIVRIYILSNSTGSPQQIHLPKPIIPIGTGLQIMVYSSHGQIIIVGPTTNSVNIDSLGTNIFTWSDEIFFPDKEQGGWICADDSDYGLTSLF